MLNVTAEDMEGRFWFANSYAEAAGRFLIACDDLRNAGHKVENERLEIGNRKSEIEDWTLEIGHWKWEAGSWNLKNWHLETGN